MTLRCACLLLAALALACAQPAPPRPSPTAASAEPALAAPAARWLTAEVRFASAAQARELLGRSDAFTRAQGDLDRQLRRAPAQADDEPSFLAYAADQALAWDDAERDALAPILAEVGRALEGLSLALPPRIWLVKTSGAEEFTLPYTRGAAIIVPRPEVELGKVTFFLLAHELLHVATRHRPALRDRLYPLFGFERVEAVAYPPELAPTRVTNPDAFGLDHAIAVTVAADGREARVVPIIQCRQPPSEAVTAQNLLQLLSIELIELDATGAIARAADGRALVHAVEATDFTKRASINTDYAIHPEEVLADNFALLLTRRAGKERPAPRPEILSAIEAALR
jgi:hypothetical protein